MQLFALETAIDGGWGQWSRYSECSKSCGSGRKRRSRVCNDPRPAHGGRPCVGSSTEEQPCNTKACKFALDGIWGQWSRYGECSKSCGSGRKRRSRVCNNPRPTHSGRPCVGSSTEERPCNTKNCTGMWSPYTTNKLT